MFFVFSLQERQSHHITSPPPPVSRHAHKTKTHNEQSEIGQAKQKEPKPYHTVLTVLTDRTEQCSG